MTGVDDDNIPTKREGRVIFIRARGVCSAADDPPIRDIGWADTDIHSIKNIVLDDIMKAVVLHVSTIFNIEN